MFVVGLTGGIGSGKSTVAKEFEALGIVQVDADIIAREVVEPGQPALSAIAEHFGNDILLEDGSLNRPLLRERIFADKHQRLWLEQLLHPVIRQLTIKRLEQASSEYCLLTSPLLLETDQHILTDHILVVDIPEALQLERTTARDNNSTAQVQAIIEAQIDRQKRLNRADSVIDNSTDPSALSRQVKELHNLFLQLAKRP
ncbi:MAG: dephospho-CoA kinase [Motiliproteus sp.]|nr:dephospho-CoA kinase [Motiliproteus sp.]MCW9052245.1 dephospho-CoA kinase [Motiliproteus sp.]